MEQEKEKKNYIEKAKRINDTIDKILKMESGDIITNDMKLQLEKIQKEACRVYRKLEKDEFEIAIVGQEKAGKSSFSNALIERNLLPTADERCTYTATCMKYAEDDNATICFYGIQEFERDFVDKLRKIGIKNPESYSYQNLTEDKYKELYRQRSENGGQFDETLNEDILNIIKNRSAISRYLGRDKTVYAEDELTQSEFQKFIREPAQAIPVKEVTIGSRALSNMKTAIIYDVPGFNSPTEMHKEQTLDKMKSADVIIMVAKGDEPSITGDVLKIFRESDNDGTQLKDKLFVFANKSDRGGDFKRNQEITYEQWVNKYDYIDREKKDKRIIFGSANAHLERCGQLEGDDCTRAVEKKGLPHGDGIDHIKARLEEYNRTDRFNVLKRRIDKLGEDLKEIFRDVASEYGNSWGEYDYRVYSRLGIDLFAKAQKMIPEILDEYKEVIKSKMSEKTLSQNIEDKISEVVSLEEYKITDEEIQKQHAKYSKSAGMELNRIDTAIRAERCDRMYDRFSREVVKMVLDQHKQCEENIVDKCLEAIGVSETSRYRDELKGKLKELLKDVIGYGEGDYYQSLIERYSRDIYEILIYSQYNAERLERFYEDAHNFYSLSIFYRPRKVESVQRENESTCEDEDEIICGDEVIKNLPMCRKFLFHTTEKGEENTMKAYEKIHDFFREHNKELLSLVRILGALAPMDVEKIVSDICRLLNEDDESTRLVDAKELLKRKIRESEKGNIYAMDILDKENFKIQYKRFHEARNRNYDSIINDFWNDMVVLKDILTNAFVPAINIEKPFLAKEQKIIEGIKGILGQEAFRDFIIENMPLIDCSEWEELNEAEGKRRLNEACMRDIQKLLREING